MFDRTAPAGSPPGRQALRAALIAVGASLLLGLVGAPAAQAGSYTVDVGCRDGTLADEGAAITGWHRSTSSRFNKAFGCGTPWTGTDPARWGLATAPNGLSWSPAPIPQDRTSGWSFLAPGHPVNVADGADAPFAVRNARISSVRTGMVVRRNGDINMGTVMLANGVNEGSGLQLLYGCAPGSNADFNAIGVTSPNCASTGASGFLTTSFNVPGVALSIGIGATCPAANCGTAASNGLVLMSSEAQDFTVTEIDGPEITGFTPPSTAYINAAASSSSPVAYSARDLVGLDQATVIVDGATVATDDNASCANTINQTITNYAPCISGADQAINNDGRVFNNRTVNINTAALADGNHSGILRAFDALSNTTDRPFTIRVDRTAPTATAPTSIPSSRVVTFTGISDATSGIDVGQFVPEYSTNGGATWLPLTGGSYNAGAGTYTATLPSTVPAGSSVMVRLAEKDIAGNPRVATSAPLALATQCSDGTNNDGDGLIDTNDPACHSDGNPGNPNTYVPTLNTEGGPCGDGIDNNGDGLIDRLQPSCHTNNNPSNAATYDPTRTETTSAPLPQCSDSADNDGDGLVDTNDPACHSDGNPANSSTYISTLNSEAGPCGDGIDNNGDGLIDRLQPSCHTNGNAGNAASYDPTRNEVAGGGGGGAQCSDNADNDGDGRIDTLDPACHSDGNPGNPSTYTPNGSEGGQCGDAIDNNGDGLIDRLQPSCHTDGNPNNPATYDPTRTEVTGGSNAGGGGAQCRDGVDNDNDGLADIRDPACHSDGDPANPASYTPSMNSESGDCGDGKDNNNDGQIDRNQASCHTDRNINNDNSFDPKRSELADAPASVCGTRKLNLLDVYTSNGRVQLLGYAKSGLVGKKVRIVQHWNGATAVTLTVGDDGYFRGSAALPPRGIRATNRARYQARIGSQASLNLKLARRMVSSGVRIMPSGKIKMTGRVTRPLRARGTRQQPITIKRRLNCNSPYTVVKTGVKVSSTGTFTAVLPAPPPGSGGAVYRAQTRVPKRSIDRRTSPTFTLPRAVDTR